MCGSKGWRRRSRSARTLKAVGRKRRAADKGQAGLALHHRYGEFQVQDQQGCVSPSSPGKNTAPGMRLKDTVNKMGKENRVKRIRFPKVG